jgi:hypothetical protein
MTRNSKLTALAAALAALTTLATSPASSQTATGSDVSRSPLTGATTTSPARSDSSNTHLKPTCNDSASGMRTTLGDCSSSMGPDTTTTLRPGLAQPVNKSAASATTATRSATPKSSNTTGMIKAGPAPSAMAARPAGSAPATGTAAATSAAAPAAAPAAGMGAPGAATASKGGAAH